MIITKASHKNVMNILLLLLLTGGLSGCDWIKSFFVEAPDPRLFGVPPKTTWIPQGPRTVGSSHPAIPVPDTFHTMHVGVNNTDEIYSVVAPMVEFDWIAEDKLYVPEGPTLDNEGNLYFSPLINEEGVSLVSLDRETGKRRWAIKWGGSGGGAPLILNDPDNPGKQIIYHCTFNKAWAIRPDGTILWEVENGREIPAEGGTTKTHCWGMNYIPQADALTALTGDAKIYVMDRGTGRLLLSEIFELPGDPTPEAKQRPPQSVMDDTDIVMEEAFGRKGLFTTMIDVLFGGGSRVSNFYGVDPNTGNIYVAATAPDKDDGKEDGVSEYGALYRLGLVPGENGEWVLKVINYIAFPGGSGSTPTIRFDSKRVVIGDEDNNLIALDMELNELWKLDVGEQLAASIAVASDNNEMYAVTKSTILKIKDQGNSAKLVWRAKLDVYPERRGYHTFNGVTPTITPNGIAVGLDAGYKVGENDTRVPTKVGVGVLDRETGELRYYAEGQEESIAVTVVGPDGGFYMANSPVRRAIARAMFPKVVPPLRGGISRYKPIRLELLIRDATCAGAARVDNSLKFSSSIGEDIRSLQVLIDQSQNALPKVKDQDLSASDQVKISKLLLNAEANLSQPDLEVAGRALGEICGMFE